MPEPGLNPDDKMQAQLLAGSLRAFVELMRLSPWLLVLSLGLMFSQPLWFFKGGLLIQLLVTFWQSYLAWRLRWDAELFQSLADGGADEVALDKCLLAFRKSMPISRPFSDRVRGTQKLMFQFGLATLLLWIFSISFVVTVFFF